MPDGGTLTITTANASFGEDHAERHPGLAPGDHLVLTVTDTGAGIGKADRAHVFEPFFSTRPGGGGMGLTTCYGIVTRAGGQIRLESEPGSGTVVICAFPRAVDTEPASTGRAGPITAAAREPCWSPRTSRWSGRSCAARCASSATTCSRRPTESPRCPRPPRRAAIALLVTDVVMPRMDGRELAEQLREQRPGCRAVRVGLHRRCARRRGRPRDGVPAQAVHGGRARPAVRGLLDAVPAASV